MATSATLELLRRRRAVQNQIAAQSLASGIDPSTAPVTQQQMESIQLPRIVRIQAPDGQILEAPEDHVRVFMRQNPGVRILGFLQ